MLLFSALSEIYTTLGPKVYDENGALDLTQTIYIDWGAFINAIINFFLVAIVLFTIVKLVNTIREGQKKMIADIFDDVPRRADFKEMKRLGMKITDDNIEKFMAEKKERILQEAERAKAEAEEKIADAEEELADAKREVADIENGEWFILPRAYNPGYTGFGQDADRMANLATVFPIIFFLVAALVCLTTMTRMVEDHRTQIGLMKALGYNRWAISKKYLGYGLLPSLLGSVLGLAIGHLLFPSMIYIAYQIMYEMPDLQLRFYPDISISATLAAVGCTVGATLFACLATLMATPANLMRPRAPKPGKRVLLEYITPLWKRMSFNWKITTRNLLRYQKRFWMTIVGIGGCTALIIAGFGLRDSLLMTMQRQFGELFLHDVQLTLASGLLESERDELEEYLRTENVDMVVLAVPKDVAIPVTNMLTANGVEAIWNFTNVDLTAPNSSIIVENVHFSDSLLSLSYYVSERQDEKAARAARAEKAESDQ